MALDELLNAEFPAHSASGPPRAPLASPPGEARGICPRKLLYMDTTTGRAKDLGQVSALELVGTRGAV